MASKAGLPVLKRRLQEKLQTLRQCEDDLSISASARRGHRDVFMRQKGKMLSQVRGEFDQLSAEIERRREEVIAEVEKEMEDLYQRSVRDWRDTEDLQRKVDLCLQDAQGLVSCRDRASFLSTYSTINQRIEDVLLEVLMALETEELSTDPQVTEQTSFALTFSLSPVTQLLLATKASVSVVNRTEKPFSPLRAFLRNCGGESALVGDSLGATTVPQTSKGQEKYEDHSMPSSSTYPPSSPLSPRAAQLQGDRWPAVSSSAKPLLLAPPAQQPNMDSKVATPQLKQLQLKIHSKLQVLVTEVQSVEQFWVQPLTQDLEKLMHEMREHFSLHKTGRKDLYSTPSSVPSRGSFCCAQFTADDEWYRAKVLDVGRPTPHSAPLMKVFYVDYGNQELQPLNRLHPLPTHLCSLPMQAISCSLANIDGVCVSNKANAWFQEYFPGQVASIEVVELATELCYLVQCHVVPAHLEGLDPATAKQLRNWNLVDVLHVLECMSGCVQGSLRKDSSQDRRASPSAHHSAPSAHHSAPSAHHSAKLEGPDRGVMQSDSAMYERESGGTDPMANLSDNSRTTVSATVEQTSHQEQLVVSAFPDGAALSPCKEQTSRQEQLVMSATSAFPDAAALSPCKEQTSRREQLVVSATMSAFPDGAALSPSKEQTSRQEQLVMSATSAFPDAAALSPSKEQTSRQEQLVVSATMSAFPDGAALSPCKEQTSRQEQLVMSATSAFPDEAALGPSRERSPANRHHSGTDMLAASVDCTWPNNGANVPEEQSVQSGGLLAGSSVVLNTSGTEPSMDLQLIVPSQDEIDVRRTGLSGCVHSASVEDVNVDLSVSSSDHMKDVTLKTPPTLSELNMKLVPVEDNSFALIVSNIISPSLFYAHVVSPDSSDLDLLQQRINQYYGAPDSSVLLRCSSLSPSMSEDGAVGVAKDQSGCTGAVPLLEVGSMCAAKLPEDDCWYRGVVIGVREEVEEVMKEKREMEGTKEEAGGGNKGEGKLEGGGEFTRKEMRDEEVAEEREEARELEGPREDTKEEESVEDKEERQRSGKLEGEREEVSSKAKSRITQYHIHYIDYGDAAWVSVDQVRALHRQFLNTPMQTVRLSLVGVAPAITPPTSSSERLAQGLPLSDEAMKTPPAPSSKSVKTRKKAKKKQAKQSSRKLSCSALPVGGEAGEDGHQGHLELRSPSDSQLKDFPKMTLQGGALYSSAPDICQRLRGSNLCVQEASNDLDQSFCSAEEEVGVVWSKEAVAAFQELAGEQVLLAMVLEEDLSLCLRPGSQAIQLSSVMEVLPVMLYNTTSDEDVFINGVLVERGLARIDGAALSSNEANSTQPLSPTSPSLDNWDPLKKHFLAQSNDYERSQVALSEKRVELCRHFNSKRGCSRGNRCMYIHAPIGPFSDVKSLESAAPNLRLCQALPSPNTWVAVEVITVVSPNSFYIHFPLGSVPLLEQQAATSAVGGRKNGDSLWTFEQLQEDMNARYSMSIHQQRQGSLLAEGELVASCYSGDDRWYRALVLKTNSARNYVAVFYVDFGNSEELPESRVRSLSQEFTHLPFQAVECRLADVSVVTEVEGAASLEDAWRGGITALADLVKDRVLVAKIVRPFPVAGMEVELYDTSDDHCDILINKKMVELGHLLPSSSSDPHASERQACVSRDPPPRKGNYARSLVMLPG